MKKTANILALVLTLLMVVTGFTACDDKADEKDVKEGKEKSSETITTDEAEKTVEEFMDIIKSADSIDAEDVKDLVSEDVSKDVQKSVDDYKEKFSKIFGTDVDEDDSESGDFIMEYMNIDYEINDSEEKDDKVIVEVEVSNSDLSALLDVFEEFQSFSDDEAIEYMQNAVDNGLISVNEANGFINGELNEEESAEFIIKLAGSADETHTTVEFTVTKDGDDVLIDEIDSTDDFVAAIMLNLLGTL